MHHRAAALVPHREYSPFALCQTHGVEGTATAGAWLALGTLVGRDELVASVVAQVFEHRLVTLTGVGGVGKTRLVMEVAAAALPHFRDGVWFVDLAAVYDAAAVADAVASMLGIAPQADTPVAQTLIDALANQQLLLVLDNCEHVVGAAAELAHMVLSRSDRTRNVARAAAGDRRARRHCSVTSR